MNRDAYVFYYGGRVLAEIHMPVGTPIETARAVEIRNHDKIPLCYPVAPFEHRAMLQRADIRTIPVNYTPGDSQP